jgi:HPt (histidine-containing phosphotransfer) domain-containing protein
MIDEIQARFLPRFVAGARERLQRAARAIADGTWRANVVAAELHTIAGEASVMGLPDVAELARATEKTVRQSESPDGKELLTALGELGRRIDELAAAPPKKS